MTKKKKVIDKQQKLLYTTTENESINLGDINFLTKFTLILISKSFMFFQCCNQLPYNCQVHCTPEGYFILTFFCRCVYFAGDAKILSSC